MTIDKNTYAIICSDNKKILIKPYVFLTIQNLFKTPSVIAKEIEIVKKSKSTMFWRWDLSEYQMSLNKFIQESDIVKNSNLVKVNIEAIVPNLVIKGDYNYLIYCNDNSKSVIQELTILNLAHICVTSIPKISIDKDNLYVDEVGKTIVVQDRSTYHCITLMKNDLVGLRILGLDINHHEDAVLPYGVLDSDGITARSERSINYDLKLRLSMGYAMDDNTISLLRDDRFAGI